MKSRVWLTLLVSAVAGALVWALSPWLVGHPEPWDADGPFYLLALVTAGSFAGLLAPRPLWAHYIGAFAGQLIYELLFLSMGPLFVLGAAFLLAYSLVFSAAAALAAYLRVHIESAPS
ncbi:MAG: hypothetical protein AB1451_00125 [Nitrospirota bacterium]